MSEKERISRELSHFLLIEGIHWERLPEEDLKKLYDALVRLKDEVVTVFELLDTAPLIPEDKGDWKHYVS